MTDSLGKSVVLDTTVLVHLARKDDTGKAIEADYGLSSRPERPIISTVTEGEMFALARLWSWGPEKVTALRKLLDQLVRVEAGLPEIVETYAELYAEATKSGDPRGENDLWIAATAKVLGADLFTCDTDFAWLHPQHITVVYIPEMP